MPWQYLYLHAPDFIPPGVRKIFGICFLAKNWLWGKKWLWPAIRWWSKKRDPRFLAATEFLESDLWEQYWELRGNQTADFASTNPATCKEPAPHRSPQSDRVIQGGMASGLSQIVCCRRQFRPRSSGPARSSKTRRSPCGKVKPRSSPCGKKRGFSFRED
jgi:hypothetical protein